MHGTKQKMDEMMTIVIAIVMIIFFFLFSHCCEHIVSHFSIVFFAIALDIKVILEYKI